MKPSIIGLCALAMLLLPIFQVTSVSAYTPQSGDYFKYHEVETLNSGTGTYAGYTEQTVVNGGEQINSVSGVASASYSYIWSYSNSQSSTTSTTQSGSFTFSPTTYLYVNGTDDQQGYINPTVWFYINNSAPVGSTVFLLNTGATVISRNYSFPLPAAGKSLSTIFVQGISSYYGSPLDNAYGMNNAKYTWNAYFDPTTGYIIGYNYVEQDVGQGYSFTWTDNLYITAANYGAGSSETISESGSSQPMLSSSTTISTSISNSISMSGGPSTSTLELGVVIAVIIIILVAVALSRGHKSDHIPSHAQTSSSGPSMVPDVSLVPPPPQQIVIRDVAKVKCKYCGTLVPTTVKTCPQCGGSPV